jgi:hypothetical protein
MLAATSMAAPWTTTFTGPSLNIDSKDYATTAGTASWEITTVDGVDSLTASSTLTMTLVDESDSWSNFPHMVM